MFLQKYMAVVAMSLSAIKRHNVVKRVFVVVYRKFLNFLIAAMAGVRLARGG